ncbi:MAG: pyrroline-5-carboxylate reductase [Candidatus Dasytiphilus stammeri]
MEKKIGFIGCGNMAQAIIGGLVKSKKFLPKKIYIYDSHIEKMQFIYQKYGIFLTVNATEVAKNVQILFLAVKLHTILTVLKELYSNNIINKELLVVSLAVGLTLSQLETVVPPECKVVRVMSNTTTIVGEGMTSVTPNEFVTQHELNEILYIFNIIGKTAVVPEYLIHTVVGVSSSAPAYVYMFIEAMADAAVLSGMPRTQAYNFIAQTIKGAAQMVLTTGKHPGELKDQVCSPNGTTIEAIKLLEEKGFRATVMAAVQACIDKSINLTK